jgi:hypothetical protein
MLDMLLSCARGLTVTRHAALSKLVLHMAPCTGRAEVIMAFYRNLFLPVKCSGEIEKWPLKRLVLPIEFQLVLKVFYSPKSFSLIRRFCHPDFSTHFESQIIRTAGFSSHVTIFLRAAMYLLLSI